MMWPSEDKEFVGRKDSQNGWYIEVSQEKAVDELEEIPVERNTKGRRPVHSVNAYNVQMPFGRINWLQSRTQFKILQMRFNGSFSNSWRCEVSQQTGETDQVTAREPSVLATYGTIESTWIS